MTEAFFGKRRPGVFLQQFHETHDMAQRRAQIVGDGITERLQFLVGGLQLRRALGDALLQFRVETADFLFRLFALRDVADVALNHFSVAGLIHVADKLHGNMAAVPCFQRQVFIADIPVLLQSLQHGLLDSMSLNGLNSPTVLPIISSREKPSSLKRKGFTSVMRPVSTSRIRMPSLPLRTTAGNSVPRARIACSLRACACSDRVFACSVRVFASFVRVSACSVRVSACSVRVLACSVRASPALCAPPPAKSACRGQARPRFYSCCSSVMFGSFFISSTKFSF